MLKGNSKLFAAALLVALASSVVGPNPAVAAAPQHQDQQPGFYRMKVGDLEVTALFDGTGVFDPQWLKGTKATMDGVVNRLREDPHMLDVVDSGFLVNTGNQAGQCHQEGRSEELRISFQHVSTPKMGQIGTAGPATSKRPVPAGDRLQIQEKLAVFQEQLRVLVVRSVPGIGIHDQLRCWNLLRHDPGVDRRHHDVVGAVHNEGRLLDRS